MFCLQILYISPSYEQQRMLFLQKHSERTGRHHYRNHCKKAVKSCQSWTRASPMRFTPADSTWREILRRHDVTHKSASKGVKSWTGRGHLSSRLDILWMWTLKQPPGLLSYLQPFIFPPMRREFAESRWRNSLRSKRFHVFCFCFCFVRAR